VDIDLRAKEAYIFLDVDGVLNKHKRQANGYCGINKANVKNLNYILKEIPHAKIILSSAWRYMVLSGDISLRGFEYLLLIHGINYDSINNRIIGTTESDETTCIELVILEEGSSLDFEWLKENGATLRMIQIERKIQELNVQNYIILDDISLENKRQIVTNPNVGLSPNYAILAVMMLKERGMPSNNISKN
jgi:hypothetical protein